MNLELSELDTYRNLEDLHVVHGGCDISHHCHKKERYLKHISANEVQAIDNCIVPSGMLEID